MGEVVEKVKVLLDSLYIGRNDNSNAETLNAILETVSEYERNTIQKIYSRKFTAHEIDWVGSRVIGKPFKARELAKEFERVFGKTISDGTLYNIRAGIVEPMDNEEAQENSYVEPYEPEPELEPIVEIGIFETSEDDDMDFIFVQEVE